MKGGVNIIKNQAACPFKSFAEQRLRATSIEAPTPGLRAKDRGNMVHQILEIIWKEIHHHENLLKMPDNTLNALIKQAISHTLHSNANSRSAYQHYTQLEQTRLEKLMLQWMNIEKLRPSFTVTSIEKKTEILLGKL